MSEQPIELLDTGIVYRNPAPHLRSIHAWHPSLVRLDDGTLVSTFDLGEAVESLDYRTYVSRSTDEGRTWTAPAPIMVDPHPRRTTHSIRVGRLNDGTLIGLGGRYFREDDNAGLVNRETLGYTPMEMFLIDSCDGGQSWGTPRPLESPLVGPCWEVAHRVLELNDGRWLAPVSTWKGWKGEAPSGMQAVALVSHDQGRSWPEFLSVMNGYDRGIIYWEQSMAELSNGALVAVAWAVNEASGQTLPTAYSVALDGKNFLPPRPCGLETQTAKMIALRDGRLVCLYRHVERPGLFAALARVEGDQWHTLADLPLWRGPSYGPERGRNIASDLAGLKLGYPSIVELSDGEIMAVFWCCEDCVHNIRWVRLKVK